MSRHARGKQVCSAYYLQHCLSAGINTELTICVLFVFTVKDYQLIQSQDSTVASLPGQTEGQASSKALLCRYLSNFTAIISHLLQTSHDNGCPDAVEASWVLSLALKGLYNTLKVTYHKIKT